MTLIASYVLTFFDVVGNFVPRDLRLGSPGGVTRHNDVTAHVVSDVTRNDHD